MGLYNLDVRINKTILRVFIDDIFVRYNITNIEFFVFYIVQKILKYLFQVVYRRVKDDYTIVRFLFEILAI